MIDEENSLNTHCNSIIWKWDKKIEEDIYEDRWGSRWIFINWWIVQTLQIEWILIDKSLKFADIS